MECGSGRERGKQGVRALAGADPKRPSTLEVRVAFDPAEPRHYKRSARYSVLYAATDSCCSPRPRSGPTTKERP